MNRRGGVGEPRSSSGLLILPVRSQVNRTLLWPTRRTLCARLCAAVRVCVLPCAAVCACGSGVTSAVASRTREPGLRPAGGCAVLLLRSCPTAAHTTGATAYRAPWCACVRARARVARVALVCARERAGARGRVGLGHSTVVRRLHGPATTRTMPRCSVDRTQSGPRRAPGCARAVQQISRKSVEPAAFYARRRAGVAGRGAIVAANAPEVDHNTAPHRRAATHPHARTRKHPHARATPTPRVAPTSGAGVCAAGGGGGGRVLA